MYKEHKALMLVVLTTVFIASYVLKINYNLIATETITIISIALAVYMASFSQLAASKLAEEMKKTPDKKIFGKSELGVLESYLKKAIIFGLISIVISCMYLLDINVDVSKYENIFSSIALSILSVNFIFIWLLFNFMVNRQLREK